MSETRKELKQFAENSSKCVQPGSVVGGSPVNTVDPDTIQSLGAYTQGLDGMFGADNVIAWEELNAVLHNLHKHGRYIYEAGIPEWHATTTYKTGSLVRAVGGLLIYRSLVDTNLNNALADTTKWKQTLNLGVANIPIGKFDIFPIDMTIADGWLKLDGTTKDQADFSSSQWTEVGTLADNGTYDSITRVDSDTIQTIDGTKYLIRPNGSNSDIGQTEEDAFQGHAHVELGNATTGTSAGGGVFKRFVLDEASSGLTGSNIISTSDLLRTVTDGTNGTPRTASVTRDKSINGGFLYVFIGF